MNYSPVPLHIPDGPDYSSFADFLADHYSYGWISSFKNQPQPG